MPRPAIRTDWTLDKEFTDPEVPGLVVSVNVLRLHGGNKYSIHVGFRTSSDFRSNYIRYDETLPDIPAEVVCDLYSAAYNYVKDEIEA